MAGRYYNGYSWAQRVKILRALDDERAQGRTYLRERCDICEDRAAVLHSEDYSEPYSFVPPQCYSLCRSCHRRIHRRFNEPPEVWWLWLEHLKAGGYGTEFSAKPVPAQQMLFYAPRSPAIRQRTITGMEWWLHLSLDPRTLTAAWARPRPLRERPTVQQYSDAIRKIAVSPLESSLLHFHAKAEHRSIGMAALSQKAFASFGRVSASKVYRDLGKRLCEELQWEPDRFRNGYPNWTSVIAESWRNTSDETEWVLIQQVHEINAEIAEIQGIMVTEAVSG